MRNTPPLSHRYESSAAISDPATTAWLLSLRWCAIGAQMLVIAFVTLVYQLALPLPPIVLIILLTAASNLYFSRRTPLTAPEIGAILLLDTASLTSLLYLTGGPENPFSIMYLVHVVMAAVLLGTQWTWLMTGLSVLCFGALFPFHLPIGGDAHAGHHAMNHDMSAHLQGMWISFVVVALLTSYFLTRILASLKIRDRQLAKSARLASLTTLAAGAAHELSTPLATISLVAGELKRRLVGESTDSDIVADFELLESELQRSTAILEEMRGRSAEGAGEAPESIPLQQFFTLLLESIPPSGRSRVDFVNLVDAPGQLRGSELRLPVRALRQALCSLIRNSLEASPAESRVVVSVRNENTMLVFRVEDKGHGMDAEILSRVGEPFFTTKEPGSGMGLGVFLAKLVAERSGGALTIASNTKQGTAVSLTLPQIEQTAPRGESIH